MDEVIKDAYQGSEIIKGDSLMISDNATITFSYLKSLKYNLSEKHVNVPILPKKGV